MKSGKYVSFLLRMWRVEEAGRQVWRASLENPSTGEQKFFASLPSLFSFIENGGKTPEVNKIDQARAKED